MIAFDYNIIVIIDNMAVFSDNIIDIIDNMTMLTPTRYFKKRDDNNFKTNFTRYNVNLLGFPRHF